MSRARLLLRGSRERAGRRYSPLLAAADAELLVGGVDHPDPLLALGLLLRRLPEEPIRVVDARLVPVGGDDQR